MTSCHANSSGYLDSQLYPIAYLCPTHHHKPVSLRYTDLRLGLLWVYFGFTMQNILSITTVLLPSVGLAVAYLALVLSLKGL